VNRNQRGPHALVRHTTGDCMGRVTLRPRNLFTTSTLSYSCRFFATIKSDCNWITRMYEGLQEQHYERL